MKVDELLIAHTEPEEGEDEGVIKCVPQGAFPAEAQILDGVFTLPAEPFDGEEEEDEQCRGDGIVASREKGKGEERGGEDARDVGEGLVEVIGTEEDPGEDGEGSWKMISACTAQLSAITTFLKRPQSI